MSNSNYNPNFQPWWDGPGKRPAKTIALRSAVVLSIVVGVVAGAIGASSSGSLFGHSVNLVKSSSAIERPVGSVAEISQRVLPSVVSIEAKSSDGGATGSGFVIDSRGYILTNNHVIASSAADGGKIFVRLSDGRDFPATVVGRDSSYDLAVLKIANTSLKALQFGDSDKVAVGDSVIAIGSPLGLAGTVTLGIISAKDRPVTAGESSSESSFINALQTDAAINPGNSGGPLVDSTGSVIGVNSAIAALGYTYGAQRGSIGLGFAIPINQARKTAEQLIRTGKATYPVIGISVDMTFRGDGALIRNSASAIVAGGPAAKAGLKPGDIITELAGRTVNSAEELIVAIRSQSVGERVSITYSRKGKVLSTSVTLEASK